MKRFSLILMSILMIGLLTLSGWAAQSDEGTISLLYDDRKPLTQLIGTAEAVTITDQQVTSKQVGTDQLDQQVLKIENGVLYAVGVGSANMQVGGRTYQVTVNPAPISLFMITGHSVGRGEKGNGEQSVAIEAGQAYSTHRYHTYSDTGSTQTIDPDEVTSTTGLGYAAANRLTGIDDFAAGEGGTEGEGSALAWRWNQLTGEKVWIINSAVGGSCLNEWIPGAEGRTTGQGFNYHHDTAVKAFQNAQRILKAEIAAGHYTMSHMAVIYHSAANFSQFPNWSISLIQEYYDLMWNDLKTALETDLDGDGRTETVEALGFVPIWTEGGRNSFGFDKPANYYMAASEQYPDMFMASLITRGWMTQAGLATFPDITYPTQSKAVAKPESVQHTNQGGSSTESVFCAADTVHLSQVAYNAQGIEIAENLKSFLTGNTQAQSVKLTNASNGAIGDRVELFGNEGLQLVVHVEPLDATDLTFETTGAVKLEYPLLLKPTGNGAGQLIIKQGSKVLKTLNVTAYTTACVCGSYGADPDSSWTAWNQTDSLPASGNYYLTKPVTLKKTVTVEEGTTLNLRLEGQTITGNVNRMFDVKGTLNICSCAETGKILFNHTAAINGSVFQVSGKLSAAGITIEKAADAAYAARGLLHISTASAEVKLYNTSITGGAASEDGGNIWSTGQLYMEDCTISGGTATQEGGNIFQNSSKLTLVDCTVTGGNSGTQGGNLYTGANADVTLTNCQIGSGSAATSGGNISAYGNLNLDGCAISGGTASINGGSIYFKGTSLIISGGSITGGQATAQKSEGNAQGGNLCINGGSAAITDCTIKGGKALRGGNIWMNVPVTLDGCTVSGGTAELRGGSGYDGCGGNIFVPAAQLTLIDTSVTGGTAEGNFRSGDIIHYTTTPMVVSGTTSIHKLRINNDGIRIGQGGLQGQIRLYTSAGVVASQVTQNYANCFVSLDGNYKVIYNSQNSTLELVERSLLDHCVCGGMLAEAEDHICRSISWVDLTQAHFTEPDGVIVTQNGTNYELAPGSYCLTEDITFTSTGSIYIMGNTDICLNGYALSNAGTGRVIEIRPAEATVLNICDHPGMAGAILGRGANGQGGLILSNQSYYELNIYGVDLHRQEGTTVSPNGGVIRSVGPAYLYGCTISGGRASGNGGNIMSRNDLYMVGCSIANGEAAMGGNLCANGGNTVLIDCNLENGVAVRGGNLWNNASVTLDGCTLAGGIANAGTAAYDGCGGNIMTADSNLILMDCTITGGTAAGSTNFPVGGKDIFHYAKTPLQMTGNMVIDGLVVSSAIPVTILERGLSAQSRIGLDARTYLDLNGQTVQGTITGAGSLRLVDTVTDDYAGVYGQLQAAVAETVVLEQLVTYNEKHYYTVATENGYSAHRYAVQLTYVSLDPVNDALGYKAQFWGDPVACTQVAGYGFHLWVDGGEVKTFAKSGSLENGRVLTLRLKNILASGGGEMTVNGNAFVIFGENTVSSDDYSTSMKTVLELVDANIENYTTSQLEAVQALIQPYAETLMQNWAVKNLLAWENLAVIYAGYGRRDITPTASVPLEGYGNASNRYSQNVLDSLYITCVAFTDENENTALLFSVDTINMNDEAVAALMEAVHKATGIPADNMIFAATHTHSGPSTVNEVFQPLLVAGAVEAAQEALADRQVAEIYGGSVQTEKLTFVRHYVNTDGTVAGNGFGTYKTIAGHTTQADGEMQLLMLRRADKAPIVMMNFQAHPSLTGGFEEYNISADFVGACRSTIEAQTGCQFVYFTGAAGNLNAASKIASENLEAGNSYSTNGAALAQYAIKGMDALTRLPAGTVASQTSRFVYEANHADADKLPYCQLVIDAFNAGGAAAAEAAGEPYGIESVSHARSILNRENERKETYEMDIRVVNIGSIGFVAAPYEMFDTQGMYIKENSPMNMTFVLTCANGHAGYIPSQAAYTYGQSGAYEAYMCRFTQGAGEALAEAYVAMLQQLKASN